MPELPEVECVVRSLRPRIERAVVTGVATGGHRVWRGFEPAALIGRQFAGVRRRAKRILVDLAGGGTLGVHLGMTGQLRFVADPLAPAAQHTHVRLALRTVGGVGELRFVDARRFGGLRWFDGGDAEAGLGPEPLTLSGRRLGEALARTRRPIKAALLDQALIAGLGNIYVDEALHAARLHPLTPGRDVGPGDAARLGRAIKATLRRAIAAGGSTLRDYVDADGRAGGFQDSHRVYGQTGKPCRRCRRPIERIVLGGRSTHFCPACQPAG